MQAFLKLLVAIILLVSGYKYLSAGLDNFWQQVSAIEWDTQPFPQSASPLFRDYFEIMFCPFVVGIAIVCQPHILTKSFFLKKESDVNECLSGIASVLFSGFLRTIAPKS